jgi:hypothetical protein
MIPPHPNTVKYFAQRAAAAAKAAEVPAAASSLRLTILGITLLLEEHEALSVPYLGARPVHS